MLKQGSLVEIRNKQTGKMECWEIASRAYPSMGKANDAAEDGISEGHYSTEWTDTYKHTSSSGKSFPKVTYYYVIERDFVSEGYLYGR